MKKRISFKYRFILSFLTIELFFLALIIIFNYNSIKENSYNLLDKKVKVSSELFTNLIKTPVMMYDIATIDDMIKVFVQTDEILKVEVKDKDNNILSVYEEKNNKYTEDSTNYINIEKNIFINSQLLGKVEIIYDIHDIKDNINHVTNTILLIAFIEILSSIFISSFIGRKISNAIEQLQNAVHDMTENEDKKVKINIKTNDELEYLSNSFMNMQDTIISRNSELKNLNSILEEKVIQRTQKIEEQKVQLEDNIIELQQTQKQLVQSEKLASLGKLIAGISHEINTPIGAINSSSKSIETYLESILNEFPILFKILNNEEEELFLEMIKQSLKKDNNLSTKEERALKRDLKNYLQTLDIQDNITLADKLVKININSNFRKLDTLLESSHKELIISNVTNFYMLTSNNINIEKSVGRVDKIIFALNEFSDLNKNSIKSSINIKEQIENVLDIFKNKSQIKIIKEYQENLENINALGNKLQQVWLNIISNAFASMESGGTLTVKIEEKNYVQIITIKDTGCGIPHDIQKRIFEPFFTTKSLGEGIGLGLDIVKNIINEHNGQIEFQSEENVGTTFTISIPCI
jgi:two-component system NtrC family sensor kinase